MASTLEIILYDTESLAEKIKDFIVKTDANEELFKVMQNFVDNLLSAKIHIEKNGIYDYSEFFDRFAELLSNCKNKDIIYKNSEVILSSVSLLKECIEDLKYNYFNEKYKCLYCENPLMYYSFTHFDMVEKKCPECKTNEEDRLIMLFLDKLGIKKSKYAIRVLQISNSDTLRYYFNKYCPHVYYENVLIDNLSILPINMYDIVIDTNFNSDFMISKEAAEELFRILKPDSMVVFPIIHNSLTMDKWNESYSYIYNLGKEYFGVDSLRAQGIFKVCNNWYRLNGFAGSYYR